MSGMIMNKTTTKLCKIVCLFKGHYWAGGYWHILSEGIGLDRRFCGRCCEERSFVD